MGQNFSSLTEIRHWAAVDDALWAHFAKQLGDQDFDKVSLMAALQPSEIKEAVEAAQGNPITRTKLRLVYAVARVMFELDPPHRCRSSTNSESASRVESKSISIRWWAQHEGQSVLNPPPIFGS